MMKRQFVARVIKDGFLMASADKKRALQAELQQLEQMGEEVPEEEYQKVLAILSQN